MNDEIIKEESTDNVKNAKDERYKVTLPCDPKDLNEFISGLFGKPQTIEKIFHGIFKISREEIVNTFHLVDQRVHHQNEAVLVQFTVKVFYDDDSSVLFESLDDFIHYNEIKPLKSENVNLCWTYLIRFQQKRIPEKQQIDLTFRSTLDFISEKLLGSVLIEDGVIISRPKRLRGPSGISLRISHTERTWGVDIESLLTGHVKTLMIAQNKLSKFIWSNSERIGFAAGGLFFGAALAGAAAAMGRFTDFYRAEVAALGKKTSQHMNLLAVKIDFLINIITNGVWPLFTIKVVSYVFLSLVLAIFFGTWVGIKADNSPKSFVLLTRSSEEFYNKIQNKRKRDWIMFIVSIIASIITSIIANILFTKYFSRI